MLEKEKTVRGKNRIVGGVCSSLSEKYNINPWILRIIFVITSILLTFPALIYIIIWLIIPNKETIQSDEKKNKYLSQIIGFVIGGVLGWFLGYGLGLLTVGDDNSGFIVVVIFAFIGIPFGAIAGFSIARMIFEKNRQLN